MSSKFKQAGFTLIELVMVIAILGILSAIVLPRFQNLQVNATEAATRGALGAVRAALAIRYAQSALAGGAATFPGALGGGAALGAADFSDNQIPRNPLQPADQIPRVAPLTAMPSNPLSGTDTSTTAGFWYVNAPADANYGRAGAYSNGTTNTANY